MADVEALLVPWLALTLGVRVVTELPADLGDVLPVVRVVRVGGGDDDDVPSLDHPTIAVDCYGADRAAALDLAAQVHTALRVTLPGTLLRTEAGTVAVTKTQTISGPSWRPYDNTALRRFGATYRLILRSRP